MMSLRRFAFIWPTVALVGCVGSGLLTDGTSVSVGTHARGILRNGVALPTSGDGYLVPQRWKERYRNYGTEELVGLIVRSARSVQDKYGTSYLGVGDLSPKTGGATPEHLSHQNGRDVDFMFYATDLQGRPQPPTEMLHFGNDGLSLPPTPTTPAPQPGEKATIILTSVILDNQHNEQAITTPVVRKLDLKRNWAFISALVSDPHVKVQWIFIGQTIARQLIEYATKQNEPTWLINQVAAVMHQPADAQSHTDHFHVRIFCPASDLSLGCVDRGPVRPPLLPQELATKTEAAPTLELAPLRSPLLTKLF